MSDSIEHDFDPLTPAEFSSKYPQFDSLINLEWSIRQRRTNGMLEEGSIVETKVGSRVRCRIVPALMGQRLTGKRAVRPTGDLMLEQMVATNERLNALESQLNAMLAVISAKY